MTFESLNWTLAKGVYAGKPLLVRFRQIEGEFEKEIYPIRLNLFWRMSDPTDNGLPSEREMACLEIFEDRLVAAVEVDAQSILSVVLTCDGQREFVIHTRNADVFMERLSDMPQEEKRYPLEIRHYDDLDWSYDASVISRFHTQH